MTDRYNALTVVLEKGMRDDDAKVLMDAIRQMKGVLEVEGNVSDISSITAYHRVRSEMLQKLLTVVDEGHPNKGIL